VSLSAQLQQRGQALLSEQLRHPVVRGLGSGELDPAVFRAWLEQDYLFLLDYVRVFSRLAWQAPAAHLADLVDLAHPRITTSSACTGSWPRRSALT